MAKILDLKSRVPEGKYKAMIIEDSLIHDRKEIMNLIKKGYSFSSEVMETAGFIKHIRKVTTSLSIVEHKKDTRVYEKDTADIKSIIRSISTLDNGEIETVDDIENTDNDYDEEKIRTLSDETLERLSRPLDYGSIKFETETYRSGKKHIRKTRYKENPYGKIVGQHDGAQFYTIGQRKGLNIGGHKDSIFVISTDTERNIIYVGAGHTHKGLSRCCIRIGNRDIHWIRQDLEMKDGEIRSCRVRVRYRQPLQDALLTKRPNGLFIIFRKPQRGISNGQFAVLYSSDGEMLGSGAI